MKITLSVFFVLLIFSEGFGQWNNNSMVNNTVSAGNNEYSSFATSDGAGGSILFFTDGDDNTIRAQKITGLGIIAWGDTSNPVTICIAPNYKYISGAIPDGTGGAFVIWEDGRNTSVGSDVYIQHINSSGASLWTINGIRVSNTDTTHDHFIPFLCRDAGTGVIVGWTYDDNVSTTQLFAQHYTSGGTALWAANGVQVCTAPGFRAGYNAVSDGYNGAIFFFTDTRNDIHGLNYSDLDTSNLTNGDIYGQRLDGNGGRLWTNNGVPVCVAAGNQYSSSQGNNTVGDGSGGAIIIFDDERNDVPDINGNSTNNDIFAQRVNSAGVRVWPAAGVPVCTTGNNQYVETAAGDGGGGIVACWYNEMNMRIYTQKISSGGTASWALNGIAVSPAAGSASAPSIINDGTGNYMFGFRLELTIQEALIKAQKINSSGDLQWGAEGAIITNANPGDAYNPEIVLGDNGSGIISWYDFGRSFSGSNIYASKVLANGTLAGGPVGTYVTTSTGNWNSNTTWIGGVIPPAGSVVTVRHNITVTVNASCYSLTVEPAAGSVTVKTGVTLLIEH